MSRLKATCGVIGEGERAFPEVLARLEADALSMELVSHYRAQKQRPACGPVRATVARLSEFAAPGHDLCNYAAYVRNGGFVSVQTKRGCPFQCIYCILSPIGGTALSPAIAEAVVREVEDVAVRSKVRHFFFVDSVFNDPREHALTICRELARRRLRSAGRLFATRPVSMWNWRAR